MKKILSWLAVRSLCVLIMVGIFLVFGDKTDAAPYVSAVSAVVINSATGNIVYEKNAYEQRAMASTTKIMTALLTIEAGDLDKIFTVDSYAIMVEGTSMGLREGDIVTRRALCYGMLLPSGNDAANAAAVSVGGSMDNFVKLMNNKAQQLGMAQTHFANPSGLDAQGHYSTAYDMALLTKAALENDTFRSICSLSEARVEFGNPPYSRMLYNSNKLLYLYDGCFGVKTGFTDNARRCLVSAAEKDGVTLIAITLNAGDDWNDHAKMLDYGFSLVESRELPCFSETMTLPVVGGTSGSVRIVQKNKTALALTGEEARNIEINIYLEHFLYGGFSKGTYVGKAIYTLNGTILAEEALVTADAVGAEESTLSVFDRIMRLILY